jgi:hypothetical protein
LQALTVNWLMIEIGDTNGKVTYRNGFITNLEVNLRIPMNSAGSSGVMSAKHSN